MSNVTIHGIDFQGDFGNRIPAFCPNCGPTEISVPFKGMDSLILIGTSHDCLKCGRPIKVEGAHYEFEKQVFQILLEAKLTKKQAKRFARKTEDAANIDAIPASAAAIDPALGQAASLAIKQPNPKAALKTAAGIALFVTSMIGGVYGADELWDRYQKGELFENHQLQEPDDVQRNSQDETDGETENGDRKKPPKSWKPTEA